MKTVATSYKGAKKAAVRRTVFPTGKRYNSILDLPGPKCYSLAHLLANGNIRPETHITAVERKKASAASIEAWLCRHKLPHDLRIGVLSGALACNGPYDLVNLDTCSTLSLDLLRFIENLELNPGAEVNVWVTSFRSMGVFRERLLTTFLETRKGLQLLDLVQNQFEHHCPPIQAVSAAAIFVALKRYDLTVHTPLQYSEHISSMYVYRFTEAVRRQDSVGLSLDDLAQAEGCHSEDQWANRRPPQVNTDTDLMALVMAAATSDNKGLRAYVTRQMRNELERRRLSGKSPKWIKAGWKSYLSARFKGENLGAAHELVGRI